MDAPTFVLVIEVFSLLGEPRIPSSRTRDLPQDACLTLVQEVKGPNTVAYCYRSDEPDPMWRGYYRKPDDDEREPIRDCATHHYFRGSCLWPLPPGRKRV